MTKLDTHEMQRLLVSGLRKTHPHCSYEFIRFRDRQGALAWIAGLLPMIATAADIKEEKQACAQLGFTYAGLEYLGLPHVALRAFSREFRQGMGHSERVSALGDVAENGPEHWEFGGPEHPVHCWVGLFGANEAALQALRLGQLNGLQGLGAGELVYSQSTQLLPEDREHFGFRDGISQPAIKQLKAEADEFAIEAGEFYCGYPNEYGETSLQVPIPGHQPGASLLAELLHGSERRDFAHSGSFLVFRKLKQDVRRFWKYCEEHAPSGLDATALASKMVGRWPSGAPLTLCPEKDDPALALENRFGYGDDPLGSRCPLGAHVRRSNPRDGLPPNADMSRTASRRHLLLRRGRPYGAPAAGRVVEDDVDRGLCFLALCTDLSRQFEFIQQTWLLNGHFLGLRGEQDPLLGAGGDFSFAGEPVRRKVGGLTAFVQTRGGDYFFLPSRSALRFLTQA